MNHPRLSILALVLLASAVSLPAFGAGKITDQPAKATLAGTEEFPLNDAGVDKKAVISSIWKGQALTGGLTASGSSAWDFSGSSGAFKTPTGLSTFGGSGNAFAAELYPSTNDGAALGDGTHHFSDLFLATGGFITWNNGNAQITHSSGVLTVSSGELRITTTGTNAASVPTLGSTSTLTNKTLTAPVLTAVTITGTGTIGNGMTITTPVLSGTVTGTYTLGGTPSITAPVITSGTVTTKLSPTTDDGAPLGDTAHNFSDLFLASGAVINYANGNAVLTHSSGILTMGTGELRITSPGTNAASVPTLGSTSTLTNKTLTSPALNTPVITSGTITTKLSPTTDDGAPLGDVTHNFSDLFLASGATINFANGNVLLTHTSGVLTLGTGNLIVTTAGTATGSVVTNNGTQTLTNKTLTAPVIGAATGTSLTATGAIVSTGTAGIGYAAGAGGTVTQATSKSTGVTLSKTTGAITLNNAALADATTVSFTVTNTTVAATDVIFACHASAGTAGAYTINVNSVGSGSFKISVRNHSGGSLSEAIVINFAVIKGAAS